MRSLSRHVMQAKSLLASIFFIISGEFNFLPTDLLLLNVFWNQTSIDVFKRSHANDESKHSSRSTVQIENEVFGCLTIVKYLFFLTIRFPVYCFNYSETCILLTPYQVDTLYWGLSPKSPNLFPLFTLNETFIKRTRTPKSTWNGHFYCCQKFHHPTCQTPELRVLPTIFRVLQKVTWRTYLISLTVQYCFLFRFFLYRACFTHLISSNLILNTGLIRLIQVSL